VAKKNVTILAEPAVLADIPAWPALQKVWRDTAYRREQALRSQKGVSAKRQDRERTDAALRQRVVALRYRYPKESIRAIARRLLLPDERGDRKAIERTAARIRRLERK
jgi:hypothetical protein